MTIPIKLSDLNLTYLQSPAEDAYHKDIISDVYEGGFKV